MSVSAKAVEAYLEAHPDFFAGRDELLLSLRVPHGGKGSVSLVERQLALLREGQEGSREQLAELYQSAARNLTLFDKSKRLALSLIAAEDRQAFLAALEASLLRDFGCQHYALLVFGQAEGAKGRKHRYTAIVKREQALKRLGGLLSEGKPALGALSPTARDLIFGKRGKRIESALVLALEDAGLLAIGGEGAEDFTPEMDTLFIGFVAEVIARLLPRHFGQ